MKPESRAHEVAATQGGVITRQQALAIGMSDDQIRQRVEQGLWKRLASGVYRIFPERDSIDLVRGAIAALPDAVASHFTAARLHGIDLSVDTPTVTVESRTTHMFPGVTVMRSADLVDRYRTTISGLPVTTPARTLVDLAAHLPSGPLIRAVDQAVANRVVVIDDVRRVHSEISRRGRPGVVAMRRILNEIDPTPIPPSVLEARFRRLVAKSTLPEMVAEYRIPWTSGNRFDFAIVDSQLAIELDSRRWHTRIDAFQEDRERDRDAVLHGWRILRFTWQDVVLNGQDVINTIQNALSV